MSHDPHHHDHDHAHDHGEHAHGHTHERWDGPGLFRSRPPRKPRSFATSELAQTHFAGKPIADICGMLGI